MKQQVLLDTGPLAALINKRDRLHEWTKQEWRKIAPPLLSCEPVITETCFILQTVYSGKETVISLINTGVIQVPFRLDEEAAVIEGLLKRYQSVPMSLADACLVRMAELYPASELLTFDSDFNIYRKNRNQVIPVIMP